MTAAREDPDILRNLRDRSAAEGGVFWLNDFQLMVADADTARRVHADNFADLTLPDRLADQIRRRHSTPVSWKQVRTAWLPPLRALTGPGPVRELAGRMTKILDYRAGEPVSLVWLAHEVMFRSLVPIVIDGLPARDRAWLTRDAIAKLARLMNSGTGQDQTRMQQWRSIAAQVHVGLAVRQEIRGRATGRRPARADLTQPIAAELLPVLGADRAMDAVTTVLTAIAGPPGAAASCVMFELVNQPAWTGPLTAELAALEPGELYESGVGCAPVTYRFVREVLRMWTPPLLMTRSVRKPITLPPISLAVGQQYLVSPYMVHHDPRHWQKPDTFDPDRWLPGAPHGPAAGQHSVPFGWPPTACIGAGIGLLQLVLLCHLLCTRFRIEISDPGAMRMALAAVPLPLGFNGTITLR
ncbi:MAG TPA: cytochrome P450 [Streptosporangiaceae bacterium]